MFDATAKMLAELIPPSKEIYPSVANQFNGILRQAWDNVVDFIKLHYCISDRTDNDFWYDNRSSAGIPDSLKEKLDLWEWRVPNAYDFPNKLGIFHWENYLYVLYGMNYKTKVHGALQDKRDFGSVFSKRFEELGQKLMSHRELINQIKLNGLKTI